MVLFVDVAVVMEITRNQNNTRLACDVNVVPDLHIDYIPDVGW